MAFESFVEAFPDIGPTTHLEEFKVAGQALSLDPDRVVELVTVGDIQPDLIKRVAAAANGMRTGERVFFVIDVANSPQLVEVYHDMSTALREADRKGQFGKVFGPYRTAPDRVELEDGSVVLVGPSRVRRVTVEYDDGHPNRVFENDNLAPGEGPMDALFFSVSALDKFAFSYYAQLHGLEWTVEKRTEVLRGWALSGGMRVWCHEAPTDDCSGGS